MAEFWNCIKKFVAALFAILCLLAIGYLLLLAFNLIRPDFLLKPVEITSEPIVIENTLESPANHCQDQANMVMGASNGKLYFGINELRSELDRTKFFHYISVFDDGSAVKLQQADWVCGILNGYAYYLKDGSNDLYCYALSSGENRFLVSVSENVTSQSFVKEGVLYVPVDSACSGYYQIVGSAISEITENIEYYVLNDLIYTLKDYDIYSGENLDSMVSIGEQIRISVDAALIPCAEGLLVHNSMGGTNILYLICKESGNIIELFTVPCALAFSSVTVYENDVYVSFRRFEKPGGVGWVEFENDTLQGTYRISLEDYSNEKLSDAVYNGLFIFDDTGIYACDERNGIYKLDFNGEVIQTILR